MKTENYQQKSEIKQIFINSSIICIFAEIHLKSAG